jgi:hypothetical protein
MGRQRGFLPPAKCQQCGKAPALGQILLPGDKWLCTSCLGETLPGRDSTSKSMNKMIEHGHQMREVFALETEGSKAEAPRTQAQWARIVAAEIRNQGMAKAKEVSQANGEAVPLSTENFIHDTLTVPDLSAVEASFDRSRLLTEQGADVAAMALDVANTIQARDSSEKMLAHQLAALHKVGMEMIGSVVPHSQDAAIQNRRLNAAVRCMTAYQQGLLTLRKLRLGGHQRISIQHIQVREGGQAIVGDVLST